MNNETRNILMFAHTSLDLHQEERVFLTKKDKKTCEVRIKKKVFNCRITGGRCEAPFKLSNF